MYTVAEVYTAFVNGIVDKFGDASVEPDEFNEILYQCTVAELKDDFNNKNNRPNLPYAFENGDVDLLKWQTLIKEITIANGSTITWYDLEAEAGREIFHINNIFRDNKYARYVRHNDLGATLENGFKAPTATHPIWLGYDNYITMLPAGGNAKLTVTVYPVKAHLDANNPNNNIDPDLTTAAINSILIRMSAFFGAKIREQSLFQNAEEIHTKE